MRTLLFLLALLAVMPGHAQRTNGLIETDLAFYQTAEAQRIGQQVLLYQRVTGGWPKNIDMSRPLSDTERDSLLKEKERIDDSTTDNGATNMQLAFLARLYKATGDQQYRDTYLPAPARAFELPSYASSESGGITRLLMSLPHPDERVKRSIHAAMRWFNKYKLTGLRICRTGRWARADSETWLEEDIIK